MTIQREQEPALRLAMADMDYFFVLFYWLAFEQIIGPRQAEQIG